MARGRIALALALMSLGGGAAMGGKSDPVAAVPKQIKSHEHTTERAGVNLALYEKWAGGEENKWRQNGKVILLVHGATWSSRCTFDPGQGYSLMDTLAEAGYDVFAIDLHGYGKSGHTDKDWTESPSAAEDIDAAVDYIRAFRWVEKVHVLGYQWGAQPAGIFAMKKPNKVGRLILFGMRTQPDSRVTEPTAATRVNGMTNAMLKPEDGDLDPDFVRKRAQICLENDPKSPSGALRDLARASFVDPVKVKAPTLLLMGDKDTEAALMTDRVDFYKSLTTKSKWIVVVPGLGKYANFERNHAKFDAAILSFLDQP
jgi:pimeloyl-ACP methyl ester carboxylesterase